MYQLISNALMCLSTYNNNHHGCHLLSSSYVPGRLLKALHTHVLPHLSLTATFVGLLLSLISSKETDLWIDKVVCPESHS